MKQKNLRLSRSVVSGMACIFLFFAFSCSKTAKEIPVLQTETVLNPVETIRALKLLNTKASHSSIQAIETYPAEIAEIVRRGTIVFAMTAADQKPFFYVDETSKEFLGLDVELAYSIANKLGVQALFNRDAQSFDAVVVNVANGKADVALSKLSRTLKRAQLVLFSKPYITFRQALLLNRLQLAKVTTEDQLSSYMRKFNGSVGVIANSSYVGYAQANFPKAQVSSYPTWDDTVAALFKGEILGVYRDELEILKIMATRSDASLMVKPVFLNDKKDPIAMAVAFDSPVLAKWLDIFLDEYIDSNMSNLTAQSLVIRHFSSDK